MKAPGLARSLAAAVILSVFVAVAFFLYAGQLDFLALWSDGPTPGAYGTVAADLRTTPQQRTEIEANVASLRARAQLLDRGALGLLALAVIGAGVAAWRERRDIRRWHWPSLVGFPLVIAVFAIALGGSIHDPRMLKFGAADLVILGGVLFDLRRKRAGAPGRIVMWTTGVLALGSMGLLLYMASRGT